MIITVHVRVELNVYAECLLHTLHSVSGTITEEAAQSSNVSIDTTVEGLLRFDTNTSGPFVETVLSQSSRTSTTTTSTTICVRIPTPQLELLAGEIVTSVRELSGESVQNAVVSFEDRRTQHDPPRQHVATRTITRLLLVPTPLGRITTRRVSDPDYSTINQ